VFATSADGVWAIRKSSSVIIGAQRVEELGREGAKVDRVKGWPHRVGGPD
jgi:hypothetical protein